MNNHIGNIVIFGKKQSGKTELAKQMVYAISTDTVAEYRVLVFSDTDDYKSIFKLPFINEGKIRFEVLNTNKLDYSYLNKRVLAKKYPIVFCVDNIDNHISKYGKDKKSTDLIDFIHYVSEMGKVLGASVILIGEDMKKAIKIDPVRRIIMNSNKKLILQQDEEQLDTLKDILRLSDSQVKKVKKLKEYQSIMFS